MSGERKGGGKSQGGYKNHVRQLKLEGNAVLVGDSKWALLELKCREGRSIEMLMRDGDDGRWMWRVCACVMMMERRRGEEEFCWVVFRAGKKVRRKNESKKDGELEREPQRATGR